MKKVIAIGTFHYFSAVSLPTPSAAELSAQKLQSPFAQTQEAKRQTQKGLIIKAGESVVFLGSLLKNLLNTLSYLFKALPITCKHTSHRF